MSLSKDRFGALLMLVLSITYAYNATLIPELPGDEYDPFTARTFPYILSAAGFFVGVWLLLMPAEQDTAKRVERDWSSSLKLLLAMALYAPLLDAFGFIVSTCIFLVAGYWILGERRPKVLIGASIPFVVCFWFLLTQLLDVYLLPGNFWIWVGA